MYTVIRTSAVYPPFRQLHSDFGDLNQEVCHVIEIDIAALSEIRFAEQGSFREDGTG